MIDLNQEIDVIWNNANHKWFVGKGYEFTNWGDVFKVKIKDLKKNSSYRIKYICDFCGSITETVYRVYNNQSNPSVGDACPKCAHIKTQMSMNEKRVDRMYDKICLAAQQKGYTLLFNKSDYKNQSTRIKYICPVHGEHEMSANNFVQKYGCPECKKEKISKSLKLTMQEVIDRIESVNNNKLLNPEDYKTNGCLNLLVKCGCGNIFHTSIAKYLTQYRCPKCAKSESVGENIIRQYLEDNDINYIAQYKFDDCKDKKCLPFDFYLPDKHMCIEFDGRHHSEIMYDLESFEQTQKHDEIKNNYCRIHHIPLLRIPYWERQNIEAILDKELELCKRNSLIS